MFSFKKSRFFWLRSNVILILLTALLLLNKPYWEKTPMLCFLCLFALLSCLSFYLHWYMVFKQKRQLRALLQEL